MRDRIRFMMIYFTFWAVYFLAARVVFLAYHIEDSKLLTLETVFGIFFNGFRMDLSLAGYLSLLPFLWVSFSNFIKKSVFQNTIFSYTLFLVFIVTLVIVIDLEVYNIWSFRIDATPLEYLKSPKEAWASVKSSPIIPLIISCIALVIIASYIVYRIIANKIDNWKFIKKFPFVIYGLLITSALIIPIRGGFGIAPMNHSTVYFSKNNFANIAAINAPWNFFSSIIHRRSNKVNPYTYLPKEVLDNTIENLYVSGGKGTFVLNRTKPNVLLIVWESFTQKVVDQRHNGIEITPFFNSLKKEGIYFSNFYASGDRTDKALTSILSGFPAQPKESIIKEPIKSGSLPVLSKDFSEQGYTTQFYYGGDTDFANIKSYLFGAHFDKIIDSHDFPEELNTSKWGVHDQYLFDKLQADLEHQGSSKPFFTTVLTLSSHEPFETSRADVKIPGKNTEDMFMNALNYSDESLEQFINKAKKQKWWDNTLVIILADHGHRFPETGQKAADFKIPMLWTGGAIKSKMVFPKISSQIDLAATLLGQLNIDHTPYIWSKDVFKSNTKPWAFFAFNDGFGFQKPSKNIIFDNVGKRVISQSQGADSQDLDEGKAMQQKSFQDYLNR
jgi:phosphoglycerol transferase MdoB-like AlkP superfamily enzyme